MVVGMIDIDYSAETAASQSERDGPFVSARNDEVSRMNEDENVSGMKSWPIVQIPTDLSKDGKE
jgi:hypothetical protein